MSASSAKKPAQGTAGARRTRTVSLTDVRCNIANCNYSAKTTKTVENHRLKTHGVAADKSVMDQSVSASILTDSGALSDGSLELKTSTEIYNDMTKVKQSTQLAESDESNDMWSMITEGNIAMNRQPLIAISNFSATLVAFYK